MTSKQRPAWVTKQGELTQEEQNIVDALVAAKQMNELYLEVTNKLPLARARHNAPTGHPLWEEELHIGNPMWDAAYHAAEMGITNEDELIKAGILDERVGFAISAEEWKALRGY